MTCVTDFGGTSLCRMETLVKSEFPKATTPKTLIIYADEYGNEPYVDWIDKLRDKMARKRIQSRLRRLEAGLYGDCESVGGGVFELRLFFGPGYRVYFGKDGDNIVVLLCGGDKSTQQQDIAAAKIYWKECKGND